MKIIRCHSGVALIEFAILLPVLVSLFVGTIEISRYALLHLKADKTANAMADFLTQANIARFSEMDGFSSSASHIMQPFTFEGSIIFNAITFRDVGIPPCAGINVSCISWQYRSVGNDSSQIGSAGGNASLPGGYEVLQGQVAIAAEILYEYSPLLSITGDIIPALAPHTLYKIAVYKPRQAGALIDPPL